MLTELGEYLLKELIGGKIWASTQNAYKTTVKNLFTISYSCFGNLSTQQHTDSANPVPHISARLTHYLTGLDLTTLVVYDLCDGLTIRRSEYSQLPCAS